MTSRAALPSSVSPPTAESAPEAGVDAAAQQRTRRFLQSGAVAKIGFFSNHQRPQYQNQRLRSEASPAHRCLRIHWQGVLSQHKIKTFSQIQHESPQINVRSFGNKGGSRRLPPRQPARPITSPIWFGLESVGSGGEARNVTVFSESTFCLGLLLS